jgi:hypothetical protein
MNDTHRIVNMDTRFKSKGFEDVDEDFHNEMKRQKTCLSTYDEMRAAASAQADSSLAMHVSTIPTDDRGRHPTMYVPWKTSNYWCNWTYPGRSIVAERQSILLSHCCITYPPPGWPRQPSEG